MRVIQAKTLKGVEKAAIALLTLGSDASARVLRSLGDDKIDRITLELTRTGKVEPRVRRGVIKELYEMCRAQDFLLQGGVARAREILEKALGMQRALEILNRLSPSLSMSPLDFTRNVDPVQLISFIENEHPQAIALVLAHMKPEQAAEILSALPADLQSEVATRIATMGSTSPEVIEEVGKVLEEKVSSLGTRNLSRVGGVKSLAEVLNRVDRSAEKRILEDLERRDPELAENVKRLMFVFEDIVLLDDRAIQLVLREVDMKDLALALKGASEDVAQRIFRNMSERAAEMLKEDMQYMGPVRLRNVEEAQQRIVGIIRRLEEGGEIMITRGEEDQIVV